VPDDKNAWYLYPPEVVIVPPVAFIVTNTFPVPSPVLVHILAPAVISVETNCSPLVELIHK
jgi:hypothetical protein